MFPLVAEFLLQLFLLDLLDCDDSSCTCRPCLDAIRSSQLCEVLVDHHNHGYHKFVRSDDDDCYSPAADDDDELPLRIKLRVV